MSFLIAPEDKTFIYALGPGGTNTFFCQVQSAGPERISKVEKEAVAALMADAPELLEALKVIVAKFDYDATFYRAYNCREKVEPHEIIQARALIAKHGGGA